MSNRKISNAKKVNKTIESQHVFRSTGLPATRALYDSVSWGFNNGEEEDEDARTAAAIQESAGKTIGVSVNLPSGRTLAVKLPHTATLLELKEALREKNATYLPASNMLLTFAQNNFIEGAESPEGGADETPLGVTGLKWRTTVYCDLTVSAKRNIAVPKRAHGEHGANPKKEVGAGASKKR
jgi:hypothetical protein